MNTVKKIIEKLRLLAKNRKEPYFLLHDVLGFYPKDIAYYNLALVHKSAHQKSETGRKINNERLEFLGDAIIEAVVSDVLYKVYEGKREGFLTNTRSKIVKRETLNKLAIDLGLDKLVNVSYPINRTHNNNIYGNAFEALLGAIYLDQGYEKCKWFMEKVVFAKYIDIERVACVEENFKSRLIEWCQKHRVDIEFNLIEESMDEGYSQTFKTEIVINGIKAGYGEGYSKKESHQNAAKQALGMVSKNKKIFTEAKKEEEEAEVINEETTLNGDSAS